MFRRHPLLSTVTVAYLFAVGWLTLGPQPTGLVNASPLWSLLRFFQRHESTQWIHYSTVEFTANVLMFVPIGVFLVLLFGCRLWWFSALMGVLMSCLIEFTQLFIPGRVSDVRDLVSNSIGALLGVLVALILTAPAARRQRQRQRQRQMGMGHPHAATVTASRPA